ncbi:MAG: hypothetical protein E7Z70_06710 [Thermoplasmata archaeon]|nr:hypothetical protein [Thermoplasmata archaeon]
MFRIAFYGKGGIGKSTISANLSYLLSMDGSKVLHIGCDPKHDSTRLLTNGVNIRTFFSDINENPVHEGVNGISCVECGGADPGKGCAGKGLELLFSRLSDIDADYRICDVLGDVVCGGFSIPARRLNSDAIIIVTSGEFMSLFASNNILRGLTNINPEESVMGLVFNSRGGDDERRMVQEFSEATGIPVICEVPFSPLFAEAELKGGTLCSIFPDSDESRILTGLADRIRNSKARYDPRPLSDEAMTDLAAGRAIRDAPITKKTKECSFDGFDSERNLSYVGNYVMPACTSHGAVDGAMRIRDAAVILHGPRNCAFLMEYAFRRRVLYGSTERSEHPPEPGVYSTGLDSEQVFKDPDSCAESAIIRAKQDGYEHMFLVSTCTTEIIGSDLSALAERMSKRHAVDVISVQPDSAFLGSKFGGSFGLFDALIGRMSPREVEPDTVNLVARWFYGTGKDEIMQSLQDILSTIGLRIRFNFLDFSTMSEIEDFCRAEYDIQVGCSQFNDRISERIHEVTGRKKALALDIPMGLDDCLHWVRSLAQHYPDLNERLPAAESSLKKSHERMLERFGKDLQGKRVVIYCLMVRDLAWQVETLRSLGVEVVSIMFVETDIIDHNLNEPDYGEIPVMKKATLCDLAELVSRERIDLVITNDHGRVSRKGYRWAPLSSRLYGLKGVEEWCRTLRDCMHIQDATWERGL